MATKQTLRQKKYDKANTKQYLLKMNLKHDSDIIEKLSQVGSMQGYIKHLIREDISNTRPGSVPGSVPVSAPKNETEKEGKKKMKDYEIIEKYRKTIAAEMIEKYRSVLNCDGEIQYKIYIWEDGEIETLEQCQGDNAYLKAKDGGSRQLVYVATLSAPCFDPWDYSDGSAPENPEEYKTKKLAIIDCLVDNYRETVSDVIDNAIDQLQY